MTEQRKIDLSQVNLEAGDMLKVNDPDDINKWYILVIDVVTYNETQEANVVESRLVQTNDPGVIIGSKVAITLPRNVAKYGVLYKQGRMPMFENKAELSSYDYEIIAYHIIEYIKNDESSNLVAPLDAITDWLVQEQVINSSLGRPERRRVVREACKLSPYLSIGGKWVKLSKIDVERNPRKITMQESGKRVSMDSIDDCFDYLKSAFIALLDSGLFGKVTRI